MTSRLARRSLIVSTLAASILISAGVPARAAITRADVERAIRDGVAFLKKTQLGDGSWGGQAGTTELVLLALLTGGGRPADPVGARAIMRTRRQGPGGQFGTYAVALQTMALAAADPVAHQDAIARNA